MKANNTGAASASRKMIAWGPIASLPALAFLGLLGMSQPSQACDAYFQHSVTVTLKGGGLPAAGKQVKDCPPIDRDSHFTYAGHWISWIRVWIGQWESGTCTVYVRKKSRSFYDSSARKVNLGPDEGYQTRYSQRDNFMAVRLGC